VESAEKLLRRIRLAQAHEEGGLVLDSIPLDEGNAGEGEAGSVRYQGSATDGRSAAQMSETARSSLLWRKSPEVMTTGKG
jgi:hypothetical protein